MTLSGCGGDSTGTQTPVATVTVAPNPATVGVGATVQLTATLKDAGGNELSGRSVTWSSDATGVATVSTNGLVSGVAVGSANVSATSENKSGAAAVSVTSTSSGPPFGPGESGVLFTTIDPAGLLRQNSGLQQSLGRPGADEERLAWADMFGIQLGLVVPKITVPATSSAWVFSNSSGPSVIGAREMTGSGASSFSPDHDQRPLRRGIRGRDGLRRHPKSRALRPRHQSVNRARDDRGSDLLLDDSAHRVARDPRRGFDGDNVLSSAEIFTESTHGFAATGSMGTARGRHAAAALADGRVLITGGLVPVGGGPTTIDSKTTEIFDPTSGTFTPGPDMSVARFNHSAVALDDGRILVLGGNQLSSAEIYDPVANTFSPAGAMNAVHGLGHRAVKLPDGKVLVLGGDGGTIQPTAVAELFDPSTDQFTRIADMTTTRMLHFAVADEDDGTVLIGGGQDASGDLLASTEVYDPVTKTFTASGDMPAENSEQAAVFVQQ